MGVSRGRFNIQKYTIIGEFMDIIFKYKQHFVVLVKHYLKLHLIDVLLVSTGVLSIKSKKKKLQH